MRVPLRVGFCVSGEGRLFRSAVRLRTLLGIEPALLVASHRASPELEPFCATQQVPLNRLPAQPRADFDREIARVCMAAQLDLLCLTFDRILSPELVQHYHRRIINAHPSLLPAFTGLHAVRDALAAGVGFAGATIHEVEAEVDEGAIIAQCVIAVRRDETEASLGRRIFARLRPMYLQVIAWYAAGRIEHDQQGRVWVRDAIYGELPFSPTVEQEFPD